MKDINGTPIPWTLDELNEAVREWTESNQECLGESGHMRVHTDSMRLLIAIARAAEDDIVNGCLNGK